MPSLFYVSPALVLCGGSLAVLMLGLWVQSHATWLGVSLATLLAAGGLLVSMIGKPAQEAFAGMLVFDPFGLFFSLFAIVVGFFGFVLSSGSSEIREDRKSEYYSIVLALISGLVFMSISNHLLMIYLAIETVSILSYTLAGFNRERSTSVEASLKYVVYGSMASAIMVFGMSLLYGFTGVLEITELRTFFSTQNPADIPLLLWIGVLMVFAGFGYKISAAPMHMWTPDVYEGSPTPVSALLSVGPKAAGFALLIRFFVTGFSLPIEGGAAISNLTTTPIGFHIIGPFDWPKFLLISSIFTMFMGNLAALGQVSVKRILAYSSIAHAGYALMGLSTQSKDGIIAILFYMVVYCFMNLGAFWVASKLEDATGGDQLRNFRGLGQKQPLYGVAMAIFLFSLIGIPPFAGFVGKFYLFKAVVQRELYGFAILAAINSVISLYYYAKILRAIFLDPPEVNLEVPEARRAFSGFASKAFIVVLVIPNLLLGIYWEPVLKIATQAVDFYVGAAGTK